MPEISKNKIFNLYTIISFCFGLVLALLIGSISNLISDFDSTNSLELFEILINIALGVILYLIIEKKTGDDRTVKDLFHQELNNIKADYRQFMINCNTGKMDGKDINKWFKLMSINILQLETFLKSEFGFTDQECTLQKMNRDIQIAITGSEEFNNNFSTGNKIILSNDTNNKIIELHKFLKHNFFNTAVKISRY